MEKPEYQNMKVWLSTLKTLRLIHAMTGEQMVKIVDRLAKQELERLQKESEEKDKEVRARKRLHLNNEPLTCTDAVI